MSLDPVILNELVRGQNGLRQPRIGEVFLAARGVAGRDLALDGSTYLRADYPDLSPWYESPVGPPAVAETPVSYGGTNYSFSRRNPITGTIILVFPAGGMRRSTDNGASWTQVGPASPVSDAAWGNGVWLAIVNNTVQRSTDDGENWTDVTPTTMSNLYTSVATDGAGVWLLCGLSATTAAANQRFRRSTDNGLTFGAAINGPTAAVTQNMTGGRACYHSGRFYQITTNNTDGKPAVGMSTDGGTTWIITAMDTTITTPGIIFQGVGLRPVLLGANGYIRWNSNNSWDSLFTLAGGSFTSFIITQGHVLASSSGATWLRLTLTGGDAFTNGSPGSVTAPLAAKELLPHPNGILALGANSSALLNYDTNINNRLQLPNIAPTVAEALNAGTRAFRQFVRGR